MKARLSIFTVSEHLAKSLVVLRKGYCPESLVIIIRWRSVLVKIQGSNEEPGLLSHNQLTPVPCEKPNGRRHPGGRHKSFYLVEIKSIYLLTRHVRK